jgi:hypothetical protein
MIKGISPLKNEMTNSGSELKELKLRRWLFFAPLL